MPTVLSNKKHNSVISQIPSVDDFIKIYFYVSEGNIDNNYIKILDELTGLNDETVSGWLNVTPRTLRNYKTKEITLKDNIKEHIVLILSLYKHGTEVFNSKEDFEKWLTSKNLLLDGKAPMEFLDTISGIRFIDNRLTALEYGDNV